ncbi:MAG: hypothetical protein JOZ24_12470 [Candidatus Eremiobacteraeota bacterium]|nr:hypothetical protein [Candidatus Eremiobacteraeota bacterium]
MRSSLIAVTAVLLCLGGVAGASAQAAAPAQTPPPIVLPTLPPNTPNSQVIKTAVGIGKVLLQRQRIFDANHASGRVTYFKHYDLQVQTGANQYRNVRLHHGTVINPRGGTPSIGQVVDVYGAGQPDGSLSADTITIRQ